MRDRGQLLGLYGKCQWYFVVVEHPASVGEGQHAASAIVIVDEGALTSLPR